LKKGLQITREACKLFIGIEAVFELLALLEDLLGALLIGPEIAGGDLLFELDQERTVGGRVKESSGRERCVRGDRKSGVGGLPAAWE
jgi:hypothetical protein